MKMSIKRSKLDQVIQQVQKAISGKSPIRSLEGIKLSLSADVLMLRGSDNEVTITVKIPGEQLNIEEEGNVLVNGKYFGEIVRNLEGETVMLETLNDNLLLIKDNKSEFSLHTMMIEEYPTIDEEVNGQLVKMPSAMLKEIIKQTIFAVPVRDSRPILMGVSFRIKDGILECAASDTFRLTRKVLPMNLNFNHETIIPAKALSIINQILSDDELTILFAEKTVTFIQGELVFFTKIINGTFPDVSRLIPTKHTCSLNIKAPVITKAIERAALMYNERSSAVKIVMEQGHVEISSHNQEVGFAHEKLESGIFVGDPIKLTFNPSYILQAINAINNEDITFYFSGEMQPFLIKSDQNDSLVQVILPLRN